MEVETIEITINNKIVHVTIESEPRHINLTIGDEVVRVPVEPELFARWHELF